MAATRLEQQLSAALVKVTEQRDAAKAGESYAKDQLTLALAQNSALKGQLQLHEKAAATRQAGTTMVNPQASKIQATLFGSSASSNPAQDSNSESIKSTPERFDI